ncbi:MAG: DUF1848 domain-containing protein [Candidatus Sumerlaeota bacterium]
MDLHGDANILSASRRTDIPAFHGRWLTERIRAGWCEVRHPFTGQTRRVSLLRSDVAGWLFWSRHYLPFMPVLENLFAEDHRFLCQFTINGFPRVLEPRVPEVEEAVGAAHRLRRRFGPVVMWRYDPILLADATPPEWHRRHFARLAAMMEGASEVCTVSIPTIYRKTERNMAAAERQDTGARLWRPGVDFATEDLHGLLRDLAGEASERGMQLQVCCGPQWVSEMEGVGKAACMDWPHLRGLLERDGLPIPEKAPRRRATRKGCACWASVDIGRYNSCAHGCAYCYAVDNPAGVVLDGQSPAGM